MSVNLKWTAHAKLRLADTSREQGVDPSVLKAVTEHLIYQLARKMGCRRAVVKSPPCKVTISQCDPNTGRSREEFCMLGSISSIGRVFHQVRIYLDSNSAQTKFDELNVIGEAVLVPLGHPRIPTLLLSHSWGLGIETWTGATTEGGEATSPAAGPTDVGPEGGAVTTPERHTLNPEAAEVFPSLSARLADSPGVGLSGCPDPSTGSFDTGFEYQYPPNVYSDHTPALSNMRETEYPIGGYYLTQFDPWIGQNVWDIPAQGHGYYNYDTRQWEPEWVEFPHMNSYW
ncbi:hypothetical protein F4808DRAFT_454859 [Astrocystis sublimbata]|nr:hypothetical protein F4808DRAFT_454859 [Astrocystis sublimbata]